LFEPSRSFVGVTDLRIENNMLSSLVMNEWVQMAGQNLVLLQRYYCCMMMMAPFECLAAKEEA
jgi:hypothetical protein